MIKHCLILTIILILINCNKIHIDNDSINFKEFFLKNPSYVARGFDFPVGAPDAKGYYKAQNFAERNRDFGNNLHLGEDWNGIKGGNSDLGDPVYTIGNGIVVFTGDGGPGWGTVVRIVHNVKINQKDLFIESIYGHLRDVHVSEKDMVKKGRKIGTIGNVDGLYFAHLHFELRDDISMLLGGGYADNLDGFLNPSAFIESHRNTNL